MSQAGSNGSGGGGGSGIQTIDVDQSGSVTGSTIDLFASPGDGSANAGATIAFIAASGTEIDLQTTDTNGNIAIGNSTFAHNGTGSATYSTVLGQSAAYWGQNLSFTTAVGFQAAASSGTGGTNTIDNSTFVGADCATVVATTTDDTMVGYAVGNSYTGDVGENSVFGSQSIQGLVDGNNNVVIGFQSGNSWTTSESNNILISNNGVTGDQSVIRIGTQGSGAGQQDSTFIAGITGTTPTDANSPQVVVCDNTGNMTVVPDTTAGYVLTSNAPNSPTFQPASGGSSSGLALAFNADQSNVTGNGTVFVLMPETTLVANGFSYDPTTGYITVANSGTYFISAMLELTGINQTHNVCQWIIENTISGQIGQAEPGNLLTSADSNSQFDSRIDTCLNLTAGDTFYIRFTAYSGDLSIGFVNSGSFTNRITIWQIG